MCVFLDALNVNAVNDLWLELSILLKIKPHLNICNLFGFCNGENQCRIQNIVVPTVEPPYVILEYCMFGRLKDYLKTCDSILVELGVPVKLNAYSDDIQGPHSPVEYINTQQHSGNTYNSYYNILGKDISPLNVPNDSGYGDSIAYVPESVDSGYTSWSIGGYQGYSSRDYANSPGTLYNQDLTNFALQIAYGLQHLENLKVLIFWMCKCSSFRLCFLL